MTRKLSATMITATATCMVLFLCSGCVPFNYFPASRISVKDVFGKPCKGISVVTEDRTAMYVQMEGYSESYSPSVKLTTNEQGECEIPGRFRFAMPFATAVRIDINSDNVWFPIGQINGAYDSARVLIDKGNDVQIILRPLDIDHRLCNSITDESRKASCLLFSSFFSAIREGDPDICNAYDLRSVKHSQGRKKDFLQYWEGIPFLRQKDTCITMVALKTNNAALCARLDHTEDGYDGTKRKHDCLDTFTSKDTVGMIGVSSEKFQHAICSEHDWSKNEERYRRYMTNAFDRGIFLYRKTCKQSPAAQ